MRCIKEIQICSADNETMAEIKERINELIRNQDEINEEIKGIKDLLETKE